MIVPFEITCVQEQNSNDFNSLSVRVEMGTCRLSPAACIGHLTSASYVRDRNLSTNSDVVAAGQLFTCKMTPVLDLYRNITRLKTAESSSLLQKGTLCVRFANLHRLTPIDCYVLTICLRQTDLPVCLRVNAVSPSRTAPCLHV